MPCLKSPVNRIGGKYFLRHWVIEKIPEHTLYCEPFCGASHLLFAKMPSEVEVINDIDNHLIALFKVIQYPETRQALIDRLNYMPYSRALWQGLRQQWKRGNIPDDPVEASSMWFYLNRTCFGGDMLTGGFALPSITGRNPAMSFRMAIDGIEAVSKRLRNVTIECLDYADCIERYDSPDTLFYIDSPYFGTEDYYDDPFSREDHFELADLLDSIQGKAMVSHYENPGYDKLYRGWYRYECASFKGSHKAEANTEKPRVTEVLYCNFEPAYKQQGLFKNT